MTSTAELSEDAVRRVTLKDLAESCHVSIATASLVLRNQGRISAETRKRVLSVADRIGYRPDPLVSSLMSHLHASSGPKGQGVIALLTCYKNPHTREEIYLRRCLSGAQAQALRLGYRLEEFKLGAPGISKDRIKQILLARSIRGILVAPLREGMDGLEFDFEPFASVSMGFVLPGERPLHAAVADEFQNMKLILRKLAGRGYRRIGFALEKELEERSNHRWTGAFLTEQLHGLPGTHVPPLIYPDFDKRHLEPWLAKFQPDVLISTESFVLRWLGEFGYAVPKDIAFVSTSYAADLFDTLVSGVDERPELLGSASVDLLVGQLQRNVYGVPAVPKELNLPGVWTGDATAPCCSVTT